MPDMGLVATFKTAIDGIQAIKSLSDVTVIRARVAELYDVIVLGAQRALEATIQQQAMVDQIRELKEQLRKIETWETTKKRYKLYQFGRGHFAFAVKKEAQGDEPFHYLCAACYNNGKASILDAIRRPHAEGVSYRCTENSSHGFHEER